MDIYRQSKGKEDIIKLRVEKGNNPLPKDLTYPYTNESYNEKTLEKIRNLHADYYLGIMGGGDQNLLFIALLQESNNLKGITLVDRNKKQVDLVARKFLRYNEKDGREDSYFGLLRHNNVELKPCEIIMKHATIQSEISGIGESGIYFIYLSNAFRINIIPHKAAARIVRKDEMISVKEFEQLVSIGSDYGNSTDAFLKSILRNEKILEGSTIMFAGLPYENYSPVALLKKAKENGRSTVAVEYIFTGSNKRSSLD